MIACIVKRVDIKDSSLSLGNHLAYNNSMRTTLSRMGLVLSLLCATFGRLSCAGPAFEVFGKAAYSRNNLGVNQYSQTVSGATGLAILLIPQIRLEGRYTVQNQYQNRLTLSASDVLTNFKVQTAIYSVGLDISLAGQRSTFVPFVFCGAGFAESVRAWDYTNTVLGQTSPGTDKRTGLAGQVGFGIRWRIAKSAAIEIEANAYSIDFYKPGALVDMNGNAGIRLYL